MLKRAMGGTPIVSWLPFCLVFTAQTKAVDINEPRKHCWHVWSVTNKEWVKCTPHLWAFTLPLLSISAQAVCAPWLRFIVEALSESEKAQSDRFWQNNPSKLGYIFFL